MFAFYDCMTVLLFITFYMYFYMLLMHNKWMDGYLANIWYEETGVREPLWRNRRENNAQGIYIKLVTV